MFIFCEVEHRIELAWIAEIIEKIKMKETTLHRLAISALQLQKNEYRSHSIVCQLSKLELMSDWWADITRSGYSVRPFQGIAKN